jgi:hypothetical protein
MTNNVFLDKNTLIHLGNTISDILTKANVKSESVLTIKVDERFFKKIDEDLFYRNEEKVEDFRPSEDNIKIKFDNCLVVIEKK